MLPVPPSPWRNIVCFTLQGLHVVEPAIGARPAFHVVHDVLSFMELFASKDPDTEMPRVRWQGISPHSFLVNAQQYETTKTLFRTHACFQDLRDFVDFLQDFRRGGPAAARAKPEPRPPPAARGPSELSRRSRQLITSVSCQRMQSLRRLALSVVCHDRCKVPSCSTTTSCVIRHHHPRCILIAKQSLRTH